MKRWTALVALVLLSGCAARAQLGRTDSYRLPDATVPVGSEILVAAVQDGSGEDGVIAGSGLLMTREVERALMKNGLRPRRSAGSDLPGLSEEAGHLGIPFVLVGHIPKWEDNSTWSGTRDVTSIALELYRMPDRTLLASSDRSVNGVTVPEYWADWLAAAVVADILGKTPPPW